MIRALRDGFFPAVPVPMEASGRIHLRAMDQYAKWMSGQDVAGVAVWAHTGRGRFLDVSQRQIVAKHWRRQLGDKVLICGVDSRDMAKQAADCGADVLLLYPPQTSSSTAVVDYHQELCEEGLPALAFYLYTSAGGVLYEPTTLQQILKLPGVLGVKAATLDSVMTFQTIAQILEELPDKALITGEDRMFGYTLIRGASGALVGLGAVETDVQTSMFEAWQQQDFQRFIPLMQLVDVLGEAIFCDPMEGYIGRLLHVLAVRGVIPPEAACDPFGPPLSARDYALIERALVEVDRFRRGGA